MVALFFSILRKLQAFPQCLDQISIPTNSVQGFLFIQIVANFCCLQIFFDRCKKISDCGFDLPFLIISNVEYLSMCLLAIYIYAHTLSVLFIPSSAFLILVIDFFLSSSYKILILFIHSSSQLNEYLYDHYLGHWYIVHGNGHWVHCLSISFSSLSQVGYCSFVWNIFFCLLILPDSLHLFLCIKCVGYIS